MRAIVLVVAAAIVGGLDANPAGATDVLRKIGVGYSAGYHSGGECVGCNGRGIWGGDYAGSGFHDKQYYETPPNWTQNSPYCPWPRRRPLWWFPQCVAAPRAWPLLDTVEWKATDHWQPPPPALGHGCGPVAVPAEFPHEAYDQPVYVAP